MILRWLCWQQPTPKKRQMFYYSSILTKKFVHSFFILSSHVFFAVYPSVKSIKCLSIKVHQVSYILFFFFTKLILFEEKLKVFFIDIKRNVENHIKIHSERNWSQPTENGGNQNMCPTDKFNNHTTKHNLSIMHHPRVHKLTLSIRLVALNTIKFLAHIWSLNVNNWHFRGCCW